MNTSVGLDEAKQTLNIPRLEARINKNGFIVILLWFNSISMAFGVPLRRKNNLFGVTYEIQNFSLPDALTS